MREIYKGTRSTYSLWQFMDNQELNIIEGLLRRHNFLLFSYDIYLMSTTSNFLGILKPCSPCRDCQGHTNISSLLADPLVGTRSPRGNILFQASLQLDITMWAILANKFQTEMMPTTFSRFPLKEKACLLLTFLSLAPLNVDAEARHGVHLSS